MFKVTAAMITWLVFTLFPTISIAELASLLGGSAFQNASRSLLQPNEGALAPDENGCAGSLFAGKGGLGLFAPHPKRVPREIEQASYQQPQLQLQTYSAPTTSAARILHLISLAEAGSKGYDAVQHGATRRPSRVPTQMTIADIYQWIDNTPGQPHAIGRYQFIPATLKRLVRELGLNTQETFSPNVQDRLAQVLLAEAGFHDVSRGKMGRRTFMNNLAKIWAGLPNSSGKSHYHGYAGNRATMTWARFDAEMRQIFPSNT